MDKEEVLNRLLKAYVEPKHDRTLNNLGKTLEGASRKTGVPVAELKSLVHPMIEEKLRKFFSAK